MPYIPIYIGDWEQDTNCISIEAEGALLKLTFKLWKSSTKGLALFSFSQIAKLFKTSEENAIKIAHELMDNAVLNIEFLDDNKVKFESRRMIKAAEKSETYSINGAKGGRGKTKKEKLNKSKSKAKAKLIPEYEIDNEYENVFNTWLEYKAEKNQKYKTEKSLKACYENLFELSCGDPVLAEKIVNQSMANNWAGLFKLKSKPDAAVIESIDEIANQLKSC